MTLLDLKVIINLLEITRILGTDAYIMTENIQLSHNIIGVSLQSNIPCYNGNKQLHWKHKFKLENTSA